MIEYIKKNILEIFSEEDQIARWPILLPTPSSVMETDLEEIKNSIDDWKISPKIDGIRNILYIFCFEDAVGVRSPAPRPLVSLIDRSGKINVFNVKIKSKESLHFFSGTLLDCEIVEDGNILNVHVFDIYMKSGYVIHNDCFKDRYYNLKIIFEDLQQIIPYNDEKKVIKFIFKKFYPINKDNINIMSSGFSDAMEEVCRVGGVGKVRKYDEINNTTDGIVLIHKNNRFSYGRQKDLLKMKPKDKNTVDVYIRISNSKDTGCASASEAIIETIETTKKKEYDIICSDGIVENLKIYPSINLEKFLKGVIECKFLEEEKDTYVYPILKRTDKKKPNSLFVFNQTLINFKDGITPRNLLRPRSLPLAAELSSQKEN